MALSERIKFYRKRGHLRIKDAAWLAGMKSSQWIKYEFGYRPNPSWLTVCRIAKALSVTLDELRE